MEPVPRNPPTVDDVREFRKTGPWPSKSGGTLHVPLALPYDQAAEFLNYDPAELARTGVDIRGLRVFTVSDIPAGGASGMQFHRLRTEISFVSAGRARWTFEDLFGATRDLAWAPDTVLFIPPFVLHTATSEENGTAIVILANTLYDPDDPRTYDTYDAGAFHAMQDRFLGTDGARGRSRIRSPVS